MALILVTGASTGLGLATASALADAGHKVVLHARNADRLTEPGVRERMHGVVYGDLAELDQTLRLAEQAEDFGRFDVVVHNAGVLNGPDVLAVNVVAPYALIASMTPPGRTIVLSSGMHMSGSADLDGIGFSRGHGSYQDSKLYATALAMALAERRPDFPSHAVDPGWVPTRMGGPSAPDDLVEGHRTQVWLATADESHIKPRTAGYWFHRRTRRPHPATRDARFQRELLARLESHTGIALPA